MNVPAARLSNVEMADVIRLYMGVTGPCQLLGGVHIEALFAVSMFVQ